MDHQDDGFDPQFPFPSKLFERVMNTPVRQLDHVDRIVDAYYSEPENARRLASYEHRKEGA